MSSTAAPAADLTNSTDDPGRTTTPRALLAGLAATVAALIGNTIVAQIAIAAGSSEDFTPLTPGAYGFLTVVGVIAGLVGWLVVRRTTNAHSTLRWLVPTVLVLSFVPDILVGFSDRAGVSWGAVVALMAMHLVLAVTAVATFTRLLPLTRTNA